MLSRTCIRALKCARVQKASLSVQRQAFFAFHDKVDNENCSVLPRDSNQVRGLAEFARLFVDGDLGKGPDAAVLHRVDLFNTDALLCGLSALSMQCNAPTVLQKEALEYTVSSGGAQVLGHSAKVRPEKAAVANCAAVREWDSNGTVFGFNRQLGAGFEAGEFGHNDYYPTVIAACQQRALGGELALRSMVLHDEIRGRMAEVFSLKCHGIDHVVHGAIATAVVYGTLLNATVDQIESAVGMVLAHFVPFRAIRAGMQLSDSKGASAALSSEAAVLCVHRAMRGFVGPKDVFRNPQAMFRLFEPTTDEQSPFDLVLTHSGEHFSAMAMHFKLGLYEHQSAGAIQALLDAIQKQPEMVAGIECIDGIEIEIYEPAFGIIGDPSKRTPTTRQSADHSMVYIIGSVLRKAIELGPRRVAGADGNELWKLLMLLPQDYSQRALYNETTRALMDKITFTHKPAYDELYPEGIPTQLNVRTSDGSLLNSGLVMFPGGHAQNEDKHLEAILKHKFQKLAALSFEQSEVEDRIAKLSSLQTKSAADISQIYDIPYLIRDPIK